MLGDLSHAQENSETMNHISILLFPDVGYLDYPLLMITKGRDMNSIPRNMMRMPIIWFSINAHL